MTEMLKRSFLLHFAIVTLLCAGLYFIFFSSLGVLTHHGEELKIPNVTGKSLKAAYEVLEGYGFEVEVDSSYDPVAKPYSVLAQVPAVNSIVKRGRTVFLTVNKATPPMTAMPKLLDLSYRSAVMIIKSSRLVLGDTVHKPDYAKGAVLDQLYKGQHINPGDMLPQGSTISLVIGEGFGNVEMDVPDVIGMSAAQGMDMLSANGLTPIPIYDADVTDSASAIIYMQAPSPYNELNTPNRIMQGDVIDIHIKQNPTEEELEGNRRPGTPVNSEDQNNNQSEP